MSGGQQVQEVEICDELAVLPGLASSHVWGSCCVVEDTGHPVRTLPLVDNLHQDQRLLWASAGLSVPRLRVSGQCFPKEGCSEAKPEASAGGGIPREAVRQGGCSLTTASVSREVALLEAGTQQPWKTAPAEP